MTQRDSEDLQGELARLLAKSRQLRDRSGSLDAEIERLTRAIAGTEEPAETALAGESIPEDALNPRGVGETEHGKGEVRTGRQEESSAPVTPRLRETRPTNLPRGRQD